MQRKEPAAGLVDAFGDEIGRVSACELFFILEWKMPLRVRHSTAVEPNIDQIGLTEHLVTFRRGEYYVVHKRPVHIVQLKAFRHKTGCDRSVNLLVQLSDRTNTFFFSAILFAPDR